MPLLARMVPTPLVVDVRRGALDELGALLADQRISTSGRVAVAVGPRTGPQLVAAIRPCLRRADYYPVTGGTVDAAVALAAAVRSGSGGSYDAIVGVGGGRVLDATKYAAARLGLPMVSCATNLAHDGIASPVSILDNDAGRGSYGVPAPIAVVVDLDVVRRAPTRSVRAGVGEALSNLCAVADWELAREVTGEAVDGLAVTLARQAAESVLHHPGTVADDGFLRVLAEALVLSGLAMVVAGSSRPCSGACHEISHALDMVFPDRAGYHGEQVGLGAAFAAFLRASGEPAARWPDRSSAELLQDRREVWGGPGTDEAFRTLVTALRRHDLPVAPADLGLTDAEFATILARAPDTRPGRYTILEHLAPDVTALPGLVRTYLDALDALDR